MVESRPRVVRVELRGALRAGVSGKDVILALCGGWPRDVENAAVEFTGEGLRSLRISDRIAIANMTTEWGAIACVMAISTAAGVPWPETSAMKMPHTPSSIGKKA